MFRRILSFLLFQAPFFLHSDMKMLDLIILLPLIYGAYKGYKRGFIMSLFLLLAVVVGLYAAFHFTDVIVGYGKEHFSWTSSYIAPVTFLSLFLVVGAGIYFGGKVLESVIKLVKLSILNSLSGALLGLLQWTYFVGSLLLMLISFDQKEKIISKETKQHSLILPVMTAVLHGSIPGVSSSSLFDYYEKQIQSKDHGEHQ
jgi:membrane protein required for colicin V production